VSAALVCSVRVWCGTRCMPQPAGRGATAGSGRKAPSEGAFRPEPAARRACSGHTGRTRSGNRASYRIRHRDTPQSHLVPGCRRWPSEDTRRRRRAIGATQGRSERAPRAGTPGGAARGRGAARGAGQRGARGAGRGAARGAGQRGARGSAGRGAARGAGRGAGRLAGVAGLHLACPEPASGASCPTGTGRRSLWPSRRRDPLFSPGAGARLRVPAAGRG
jgi:hypothetical protein